MGFVPAIINRGGTFLGPSALPGAQSVFISDTAGAVTMSATTAFGLSLLDDSNAAAGRTTLGGTTIGQAVFTLTNPGAVTFPRFNADNTVTARSAADLRTDLSLGSIATQDANNVTITGGAISGITDLAVADGGTGASNAGDARTNLGLVIGTNVQAWDAQLDSLASLAYSGNTLKVVRVNAGETDFELATITSGVGGSTGSTDNRILRADGTGGATLQSSNTTLDDTGNITFPSTTGVGIFAQGSQSITFGTFTTSITASGGNVAISGQAVSANGFSFTSTTASFAGGWLAIQSSGSGSSAVMRFNANDAGTPRASLNGSGVLFVGGDPTSATPAAGQVQGVGGSGTNIAGAGLTIGGGRPTGSGAGGSLILATAPAGASGTTLRDLVARLTIDSTGLVTVADAVDFAFNATTGTKIGTATSQKLGFWNATPVDQPALIADPSGGGTTDAEARTAIVAILDLLIETGLMAAA